MSFTPFQPFRGFGGGAAPFNPLTLSPELWLSDTGSDPAQWDDLSGNGRHAPQGTAGNRPAIVTGALNGRQVRRFDGIDDFLNFPSGMPTGDSARTVFLVASQSVVTAAPRTLFHYGNDATSQRWNCRFNGQQVNIEVAGISIASSNLPDPTNPKVLCFGHTLGKVTTGYFCTVNGTVTALTGSGTDNTLNTQDTNRSIGFRASTGTFFHQGDIAEILVFSTALSVGNRQNVERYLGAKYGIIVA